MVLFTLVEADPDYCDPKVLYSTPYLVRPDPS